MVSVHYTYEALLPPTNSQPEGPPVMSWRIACMPGTTDFQMVAHHQIYNRTNEVRAVTCQMCKQTKIFKDAQENAEALLRKYNRG